MHRRLVNYIAEKNILYPKQFGFRSNYSTDHAILCITDTIQRSIDNQKYSCGIFLDFSKAFDTVDHGILIRKLELYGIRGIARDWFMPYLTNRKQFVSIKDINSEYSNISCGVPQGTVLGLILFLLYINDFNNCSQVLDFHLFADDSNLFYSNKNLKDLEQTINEELKNVSDWLGANKLSLNITKSNLVMFHPPQKRLLFSLKIYIKDKILKERDCIKYLGVMIDTNLRWKEHVNYINKKIKRSIGLLSKIRYYVDLGCLIKLYHTLIYPFLIYGVVAWGNTYQTIINPLFILQKKLFAS